MVDTLSTAQQGDPDILVPIDTDKKPITDEGNPAYLAGAFNEFKEWTARTGAYLNLIRYRAKLHGTKITVDSASSVFFVSGQVPDGGPYTIDNLRPTTADLVTAHDVGKTIGTDDFGTITAAMTKPDGIYPNRLAIEKEDRDFALSILCIIGTKRRREKLLKACNGSGLALIPLIKAEINNTTDAEKTLATTEFTVFSSRLFTGELNLDTFDKWYDHTHYAPEMYYTSSACGKTSAS